MSTAPDHTTIRGFYNDLYRSGSIRNPAVLIYDRLRIEVIQTLSGNSTDRILIVGCGSHLDRDLFSDAGNVYHFDVSYFAVKSIIRDGLKAFTADALSIPLPDHSFGLIICSEVLEHIPQIQIAIQEFARLLKDSGKLIVSSPNWISWFGAARLLSELAGQRPFHSSDQPYDDWKTYRKYKEELAPWFDVVGIRGVWYLPPLHYRNKGLSEKWMNRIYIFYKPLEYLFSRVFPTFGHLIVLKCQPKQ